MKSIFINKKEKTKYMIGSGEHAIFISDKDLTIEDVNRRIDWLLKSDRKQRIKRKGLFLKRKKGKNN